MIKDILESNETVKPEDERLKKLKDLFPGCFHRDGSFDFDEMKRILTGKVTIDNEGYELNFLGKNYARLLASLDTTTVVVPDEENNKLPENKDSDNIYISGDNIDALKHLLKSYEGQIKCIYIDPPYNTGSDGFVYNDKFNFSEEDLMEKLSIDAVDAERLMKFTKRKSASHSAWLTFMYPRLQLARDLLTENGAIFISVDDNEAANLKLICDEIFGEERCLGCICRATGQTTGQDSGGLGSSFDYIYVYGKNPDLDINGLPLNEHDLKRFENEDNKGKYAYDQLRKTGSNDRREDRPNMFYAIKDPDGNDVFPIAAAGYEGCWRVEKKTYDRLVDEGLILWKKTKRDGGLIWWPYVKYYLEGRTKRPSPLWTDVDGNKKATREVREIFDGKKVFDYVKPVDLIDRILFITPNITDGDIVLDFFSGSATTGHAVMNANVQRNKHYKYILVQLPDQLDDSIQSQKQAKEFLQSINKPPFLDQIGMERIRRAAKKIKEANPDTKADLGFRHYTLQEPDPEVVDLIENFTIESDADLFTDNNIYKKFGKDTILATWLIRDGYHFAKASEVEEVDLHGYTGYFIGKHLYLIEPQMPEEAVMALMDRYGTDSHFRPTHVVVFGYNFTWTELENLKNNLTHFRDTEDNLRISLDIRY